MISWMSCTTATPEMFFWLENSSMLLCPTRPVTSAGQGVIKGFCICLDRIFL